MSKFDYGFSSPETGKRSKTHKKTETASDFYLSWHNFESKKE